MAPGKYNGRKTRRSGRFSSLQMDDVLDGPLKVCESRAGEHSLSGATLKEVSIPTHSEQSIGQSNSSVDDYSVSDVSLAYGSRSSEHDQSLQDSTPQTSVVPTPATSVKGKPTILLSNVQGNPSNKRKRGSVVYESDPDQISINTKMGQSLQAIDGSGSSARAVRRRPHVNMETRYIGDSDSDTLSDALSVSSTEWDEHQNRSKRTSQVQRKKRGSNRNKRPSLLKGQNKREENIGKSKAREEGSDVLDLTDDSDNDTDASDFEDPEMSDEELPAQESTNQPNFSARRRRAGRNGEDFESWMATKARNRKTRERNRLEKAHPHIKTMWQDLGRVPIIPRQQVAQPESISRRLKPFQLEGLNWMIKQEQTHYKGGLLGDEMGMGKTIQAVSLIMSDFPAKNPTLVVVPPVALLQWSKEIEDYTNGKLKVLVFHGQKVRGFAAKDLKKYNVIMISYQSLESLYRKEVKGWNRGYDIIKEDSPIHDLHFHRVILDEAHSIKQRTTGIAKACFALKSTYKWCLSGTPVQNRIGEFFSLMRFLEVRPFADYFCKRCSCSQLHWSLNKEHRCSSCNHSGAEHVSVFNQELLNPIIQTESDALRQDALDKLRLITDRIMLRRMKRDHTSSMELPPKEIILHNEFFGEVERDFSTSIMTSTTRQFDTYVSRGVMLNNYANIFGLIMQMRQVADHPDLLLRKHAEMGQNVLVCNICDEPAEDAIRSRCKHEFCRSCIKEFIQTCEGSGGTPDCPRCHIPLSIDFDQPEIEQDEDYIKKNSIINRIKMENWTSSTKIEMLVYELYSLRNKKRTLKSIVFSQFTSMLQLIEWRLRRAGFNTVMLDGSMTPTQRQRSIDYFMNNPDVEVFLVSLKAGGVALNLTEASRVFIVDPWWNPAAEWQSADRCHRIGQKRPCVITRLCIEDSVESRIVMLQEKKANMINGTINNDKVSMDKLNPEDLQFLFRGN